MEACDVVRLFVNKALFLDVPKRAGNPGYGLLKAIRVLVFSRLKGLSNDTRIAEHLKKHPKDLNKLGLSTIPDRTTIGRWWKRHLSLLETTFNKLSDLLQLVLPTSILVVDSTPLVDLLDYEARFGYTSRGKFRGFKLHAAVNQQGLPLRAIITTANHYDAPYLPDLIWDLKAQYLLADAGYDSKANVKAAKTIAATPVIAKNMRNNKQHLKVRKVKHVKLLRAKRYVVEQFNGHLKANLLKGCYLWPKGLAKKSAMVYAALISYDAEALRALLFDETSLKTVSKYWA